MRIKFTSRIEKVEKRLKWHKKFVFFPKKTSTNEIHFCCYLARKLDSKRATEGYIIGYHRFSGNYQYKTLQELGGRTPSVDTDNYNVLKDEKFQIQEKPLEYGDSLEQIRTLDPINLEQRMAQIEQLKADKSEGAKKIKKEAREFASRYGRKYEEALAVFEEECYQERF